MGKKSSNNNNQKQQQEVVAAVSKKRKNENNNEQQQQEGKKSHVGEQFFHPDEVAVPLVPEGMEPDQLLNELSWISRLFFALYLYALIHGFVMAYRGVLG